MLVSSAVVHDDIARGKPCKRVDVPVGVVACNHAVLEPDDVLGAESGFQILLDVGQLHFLVAVAGKQAACGCHQCAVAIALY